MHLLRNRLNCPHNILNNYKGIVCKSQYCDGVSQDMLVVGSGEHLFVAHVFRETQREKYI